MDIQDNDGNTPLHIACVEMNEQVIRFLLEKCFCDPKKQNNAGKTPYDTVKADAAKLNKQQKFQPLIDLMAQGQLKGTRKVLTSAALKTKQVIRIEDVKNKKLSLDSFELIERLGKGSFGQVLLVKKKDDIEGKYYAMKVLEKEKVMS
mmetsp:Transcript_44380/g.60181  ORF Transcript_44380/g.60181 Transcript_44380/m.60181 type:complete len:148 (-) Transcript_44380:895-1338(-)